jgi:hypothetical protein
VVCNGIQPLGTLFFGFCDLHQIRPLPHVTDEHRREWERLAFGTAANTRDRPRRNPDFRIAEAALDLREREENQGKSELAPPAPGFMPA